MLICSAMLLFFMVIHPFLDMPGHRRDQAQRKLLVGMLQLTDLCLFTEARYTRHLSQADLFSAFQDHPMSFEHFPSGGLTMPPVRYTPLPARSKGGSSKP
ncbi:MAG: hypothetical protein C4519_09420 [Desulfobacteraceae bacterium]|nr:MAG: hypothetical protein C4519_09420 [Desulfobacteraceae bacterium]